MLELLQEILLVIEEHQSCLNNYNKSAAETEKKLKDIHMKVVRDVLQTLKMEENMKNEQKDSKNQYSIHPEYNSAAAFVNQQHLTGTFERCDVKVEQDRSSKFSPEAASNQTNLSFTESYSTSEDNFEIRHETLHQTSRNIECSSVELLNQQNGYHQGDTRPIDTDTINENNIKMKLLKQSINLKKQNTKNKTFKLKTSLESPEDQKNSCVIKTDSGRLLVSSSIDKKLIIKTHAKPKLKFQKQCKSLRNQSMKSNKRKIKSSPKSSKDLQQSCDLIKLVKDNSFRCKFCTKRFKFKSRLESHERIHTGEKPFQCQICFKHFNRKSNLKTHQLIHTREKSFPCKLCLKRFANKSYLKTHEIVHTGEGSFQCPICSKHFNQKSNLKTHQLIHTREKSFPCKHCLKRFANKSYLKIHERFHTGEGSFQCQICSKQFALKSTLKTHQLIHTGEKPFQCKLCCKRFNYMGNLKKHLTIHAGEKPFRCKKCFKRFNQLVNLKTHQAIH